MQLIINRDSNTFVNSVLFNSPVSNIAFKRGDAAKVELIFASENTALSATNDKTIILGLKESGKYDGTFVVSTSSYTTDNTRYVMNPSFNTVALNDLLNSGDGNDGNDVGSVDLMMEVSWSEDGGSTWYSSNTITATIQNDVIKNLEGTPLQEADPIDWLKTNGSLRFLRLSSIYDTSVLVNGLSSSATSYPNAFYWLDGFTTGFGRYPRFTGANDSYIEFGNYVGPCWRIILNDTLRWFSLSSDPATHPKDVTTWYPLTSSDARGSNITVTLSAIEAYEGQQVHVRNYDTLGSQNNPDAIYICGNDYPNSTFVKIYNEFALT